MSVTITRVERLSFNSFRLHWESTLGDPGEVTFYVYRDGRLIDTTTAGSKEFTVGVGESPVIDVVDALADAPSRFPNRLLVAWYEPDGGADHYEVEELAGATWTLRATIPGDTSHYYTWRSRVLEDGQTHQFRITPVAASGNEGTAQTLTCLMVRIPDVPDVAFAYDDADGTVTIDEA